MDSIKLELQKDNCREKLLEYLSGEIFHLRAYEDYEKIINSNHLTNSRDGNYRPSASSENSYGGNREYICLFDLHTQSEENIVYNFITPSWFKTVHETHNEYNLCYFILSEKLYGDIIPNEEGRKQNGETYIPDIEVWYPTKICLKDISKVLIVKITEFFKDNKSFGRQLELAGKENA